LILGFVAKPEASAGGSLSAAAKAYSASRRDPVPPPVLILRGRQDTRNLGTPSRKTGKKTPKTPFNPLAAEHSPASPPGRRSTAARSTVRLPGAETAMAPTPFTPSLRGFRLWGSLCSRPAARHRALAHWAVVSIMAGWPKIFRGNRSRAASGIPGISRTMSPFAPRKYRCFREAKGDSCDP